MNIAIVVFDDFTDLDVFFMWDLLNRVDRADWTVRLVGDADRHLSRTGIDIPMHDRIEGANSAEVVLFSSGPGTRAKVADPSYLKRFRLDPSRQWIGSICSGALILAALGLLDGKRATTHPSVKHLLARFPVRVVDEPFVREGNIATAGGCLAAQYLVGWILGTLLDQATCDAVLSSVQPVGQVHLRVETVTMAGGGIRA
jgi:transcriptional regulator GlxA family with amidase domain